MLLEDFDSKEAVQDALDNGDEELLADIESSIDEAVRILADRFNKGYDIEVDETDLREDLHLHSLAEHVASMSEVDLGRVPIDFIVDELRQEVGAFDVVECGDRYGLVVMNIEPNVSVWVNVDKVLENYNLIPEDLAEYFYSELERKLEDDIEGWSFGTHTIASQSAFLSRSWIDYCVVIEPDQFREICYDIARGWMRETLRGDPSEAINEFVRQLSSFDKRLGAKIRDMRDSEGVPSDEDMLELAGNWSMAGDDVEREEVVTEIEDYLGALSGSGEPPEVLIEYTRDDLRDMGITKGTLYENAPWLLVRLPPAELRAEGVAMKHCVGDRSMGYVRAVANGEIEIWSLRRASDMKPRFTLEVDGSINRVSFRRGSLIRQVKGKANRTPGFAERRSTQVTMPDEVVFWAKALNQMNIDPWAVYDMEPGMAQVYMAAERGLSANSRVRRRSFDEPYRRS